MKNKKKYITRLITFLFVVVITSLIYIPLFKDTKFGLDLKGGFEVLYQVKTTNGKALTNDDLRSTHDVLKRNIDGLGVSEPEISIEGSNRIRVKLAGITDIESARKKLSNVANISFRDVNDNLLMDSSVIKSAKLSADEKGNPAISLQVADKEKFLEVTKKVSESENGKNVIVIWYNFDDENNSYDKDVASCGSAGSMCLSAATVSQGFSSDVIIQGNFEKEEAESLATSINAGSINTKLVEISSQTVTASFGQDTLMRTLLAGILGMILVILFMTLLYNFAGFISGLNLMFYMLMVLGIFWLIGGVLTLPGIAALVLGIGMAVDSCVVTFERVKEELKSGKSLINAFISGNKLSFSTIFDANVTTLIVAIVLFVFGESSVKGFATMLIITIMATMFIMVFINRIVLSKFVKTKYFEDKANFFVKYKSKKKKDRKIDSIGLLKKCLISTSLFLIIGLIYVGISGLNLGIDFKSGSDVSIKAPKAITIEMVKMDFKKLGYNIEEINNLDTNNVYVKLSNEFKEKDINKVNKYFENKYEATTEIGVVTNIVKQELIKNAMYSVLFAAIAIIIYISFRFKFSYAMSSILALFHDVLFVIIMFSVFKIEVNVIFIAAILTIVGYSINNTIVVFDRIRENINSHKNNKKMSNEELKVIINNSVSETVTRAIYTTVTTLIPVLCLIVLGSKEILPFNLALIFGLAAGTFSSVLLAGQVLYLFEKDKSKKIR